jgi:peptidyl-prolyl cis-trans isomerase C
MENYNDTDGDEFTGIMAQMSLRKLVVLLIGICVIPIWLSACNRSSPVPTRSPAMVETTATPAISPEPFSAPVSPTSTPVPLAVTINGEVITLAEYQAEVARYQASASITGTILASDKYTIVLDELIDQTLLAQGATENGYLVDVTLIQDRITSLEDQLGGSQALQDWQKAHGYSPDDFTWSLKRSIAAAWMRDQIINQVPETAEEVHVLQILVPTAAQADEAYARLQSGEDFLDVVVDYDPLTKGDLGWFPRGYLRDPKIEAAAFALQPGQYSDVVQTEIGFHILYMLERDETHSLQPDARRALQEKALQDWITERKAYSEIQVLVP